MIPCPSRLSYPSQVGAAAMIAESIIRGEDIHSQFAQRCWRDRRHGNKENRLILTSTSAAALNPITE